jgi:predicted MPP superfamily phosphohydrolase
VLWGWFEAGWVRLRVRDVQIPGLPAELDGLRIAHLSDFHLGVPSRGVRAVERAVGWVAERQPDLV